MIIHAIRDYYYITRGNCFFAAKNTVIEMTCVAQCTACFQCSRQRPTVGGPCGGAAGRCKRYFVSYVSGPY